MYGGTVAVISGTVDTIEALSGEFDLPMISYTPYAIFSNSVAAFDINFFSPNLGISQEEHRGLLATVLEIIPEEYKETEEYKELQEAIEQHAKYQSSAYILQSTVSGWYYILRSIAIIGLMLVLVYIGIRIIIGSINDKAKYKKMLADWLVAVCLVFIMHYIMIFVISMSQEVSNILVSNGTENIAVELPADTKINGEKLEADEEKGYPIWMCNFVGYSRFIAGGFSEYDPMLALGYVFIYLVLVIYTVIFTIIYLKRVLYMAFLTMIAPLMALTYPIDKMNDGNAQGFNTWLKEYIFNALLQPFHLLIYTIVISSVMDLAIKYPVYALVALGFLIPAEKMLRKMFGFEKAQTPSAMGALGVAGAGMIMNGINKLTRKPRKSNDQTKELRDSDNKIKMKNQEIDLIETFSKEEASIPRLEIGEKENSIGHDNSKNDVLPKSSVIEGMDIGTRNRIDGMVEKDTRLKPSREYNHKNGRRKIRNRLGNAVMAVGTRYSRKFSKSHPLRTLRRGATAALGTVSLGMVGLTAGIASGDLGKTVQYTATAGIVGGGIGENIGEAISTENRGNVEAFKQGWYGDEYQDKMLEKRIKELKREPDNVQYLRERTDSYREILNDAYPEYARQGCTDIEDFWAAYQMEEAGISRESAISTYKLAQRTGDLSKSPDAESKWMKKLEEEFANTSAIKTKMQEQQIKAEEEYKKQQKSIQQKYEEEYKKIQGSKNKDKKVEYEKIQQQKTKKLQDLEHRTEQTQTKIRIMPNDCARTAIENIKEFYKNK